MEFIEEEGRTRYRLKTNVDYGQEAIEMDAERGKEKGRPTGSGWIRF